MRPLIVATALEHHLVSKYTSLVAVDVTPIAPAGTEPLRTAIPGLLPAGIDPAGFVGGLPRTATPAQSLLIVGVALAALAWVVRPRRRRVTGSVPSVELSPSSLAHGRRPNAGSDPFVARLRDPLDRLFVRADLARSVC